MSGSFFGSLALCSNLPGHFGVCLPPSSNMPIPSQLCYYYPFPELGPIRTMRHVSVPLPFRHRSATVPSPFHVRSVTMVSVHTVRHVQSPSRTAHDSRPAIISIKYAAHCHGIHFLLQSQTANYLHSCLLFLEIKF